MNKKLILKSLDLKLVFICSSVSLIIEAARQTTIDVGDCAFTSLSDAADNAFVGSFLTRAYPLLNCSYFNETLLKNNSIIQDVHGFLLIKNLQKAFPIKDLKLFSNLQTVELHNVAFSTAPLNVSFGNITSLTLTKCDLVDVPSNLLGAFPNLTKLSLSRNRIQKIRNVDFKSCQKLKSIDLGHNPIKKFNSDWLNTSSSVESLSLRAIGLKKLEYLFKYAKYLKFLDLSHNLIESFTLKSFRYAINLTTLILASNKISYIRERSFKGAFNLRFIDLTQNNLQNLNEGLFEFLPTDELTVELWENPINCSCNLKWLSFWIEKENSLGNYPDIRLSCRDPVRNHGLKFGSTNSIASSRLTCLPSDQPWSTSETCNSTEVMISTSTVPSSKTLTTSTPNISKKCPEKCNCYSNKKELPLIHYKCNISKLLPHPDSKFNSLFSLSLLDNKISSISKNFLSSFPQLTALSLENNNLSYIDDDVFMNNRKLKHLLLGPNPMKKGFSGNSLLGLNSLLRLQLRGISLQNIPSSIRNRQSLLKIDLSNNLIARVEKNAFQNSFNLKTILLENNNIDVIEKDAFRNLPNLDRLDLSENKLKTLPLDLVSGDSFNLENIELWQNPIRCDCHLREFMIQLKKIEHDSPSTEIRFLCEEPQKMRGKISYKTNLSDFVCNEEEDSSKSPTKTLQKMDLIYSEKDMTIAIIVTLISCTALFILALLLIRRRWKQKKHRLSGLSNSQRYIALSGTSSDGQIPIVDQEENQFHDE